MYLISTTNPFDHERLFVFTRVTMRLFLETTYIYLCMDSKANKKKREKKFKRIQNQFEI